MKAPGERVLGLLPRGSQRAVVPQRVLGALSMRVPLTIVRGPRGFGKTTALVRWLGECGDDVRTCYVPLDRTAARPESFWTHLARMLRDGGIDVAEDRHAQHAVAAELSGPTGPLRLIIDNYHWAGEGEEEPDIDDTLLEAVRTNPDLELIILSRTQRKLETTGALSVDLVVLRPAELALQPAEVLALAQNFGVPMSADLAEHLVLELGGWPAALHTCIATAAVDGQAAQVDSSAVDGFIDTLMTDLQPSALREFMLRTAVPEEFSVASAEAIMPSGNPLRQLRKLRLAGLLHERETVQGVRYTYPPAIRDALRRVIRERDPTIERQVHLLLMPLGAEQEGVIGALHHAVLAQEWDTALQVIEEEWATLVTRHQPGLMALVERFPARLREQNPHLQVIGRQLPVMSEQGNGWEDVQDAAFIAAAVQQRRQETGQHEDQVLVLVQTGVAALFAGENEASARAFTRVRELGLDRQDRTARLLGLGGMLMALAVHGEATQALQLLQDEELVATISNGMDDDVARLLRVGTPILGALASVDAMAPDVHEAVAAIVEPVRRDEMWVMAVTAQSMYGATYGTPEEHALVTGHLRSALRYVRAGTIEEATLASTLVEVLIEAGEIDMAEQVQARLRRTFVAASSCAYLAHAQGRDAEAIELAQQGLADQRMTARSRATSELVSASAAHRLGRRAAARQYFRRAVRIAQETGQRRPFTVLPEQVFGELAGGDAAVLALRPAATAAPAKSLRLPAIAGWDFGLSTRESEVLHALHEQEGPAGVAAALDMSVNTAKTHLRHVYRKLGAANRAEALNLSRGHLRHRR